MYFFLYIFPRTSSFFPVCFFSPLFTLRVIHRARGIRPAIFHREGTVFNRQNYLLTSTSDHNGEPFLERAPRSASLDFPKASPLDPPPLVSILPLFSRLDHLHTVYFPFRSIENFYKSFLLSSRGKEWIYNEKNRNPHRANTRRGIERDSVTLHFFDI